MVTKTQYRHFFSFPNPASELKYFYVDIYHMEKDGFWLDDKMAYTNGSTCKYYVPVGALHYIEKIPPSWQNNNQPEKEEL